MRPTRGRELPAGPQPAPPSREYLIHWPGVPHNSVSDQGTRLTVKEVHKQARDQGACLYRTLSTMKLQTLQNWNGLLQTQLTCRLGGDVLRGQESILQDAICALSQSPL